MPGQVTYIMGASGAGKTSMLNMISDRLGGGAGSQKTGKVMLNDKKELTQDLFGQLGAYVM